MKWMNLPDALVYSDIAHLVKISNCHNLEVNTSSKNDLVQSILHLLLDRHTIASTLSSMTAHEENFLLLLLIEQKQYTLADLIAKATRVIKFEPIGDEHTPTPHALVDRFFYVGWLFEDKVNNHSVYRIPDDLFNRLRANYLQMSSCDLQHPTPDSAEQNNPFVHDIISLLTYISTNNVHLTIDGIIHKRQQQEIQQLLIVKEALISGKQWRFGYGRWFPYYPNRFALLFDYIYDKQFVVEKDSYLHISSDGAHILKGNKHISVNDCYYHWVKVYSKPIRNLSQLVQMVELFCGNWVTQDYLREKIISFVPHFYYDSSEDVLAFRIIDPLIWLGSITTHNLEDTRYMKWNRSTPSVQ